MILNEIKNKLFFIIKGSWSNMLNCWGFIYYFSIKLYYKIVQNFVEPFLRDGSVNGLLYQVPCFEHYWWWWWWTFNLRYFKIPFFYIYIFYFDCNLTNLHYLFKKNYHKFYFISIYANTNNFISFSKLIWLIIEHIKKNMYFFFILIVSIYFLNKIKGES